MNYFHKLKVALDERHRSLIQDGYRDIFVTSNNEFEYIKLRHSNGNYVSLIANYSDCYLVQRTNGVITHDEKVC